MDNYNKDWTVRLRNLPSNLPEHIVYLSDLSLPIQFVLAQHPEIRGNYSEIARILVEHYDYVVDESHVRAWYEHNHGDNEDFERESRRVQYYGAANFYQYPATYSEVFAHPDIREVE